jgi:hypothetical protein
MTVTIVELAIALLLIVVVAERSLLHDSIRKLLKRLNPWEEEDDH